ncbi:MAG: hypothetical protein QOI13_3202, partial [Paraburkholderia sp.]|nr:hypothetical protein [Paraburkholderia sp.]
LRVDLSIRVGEPLHVRLLPYVCGVARRIGKLLVCACEQFFGLAACLFEERCGIEIMREFAGPNDEAWWHGAFEIGDGNVHEFTDNARV